MDAEYQWTLNRVDDIEHTQDKSGIYALINWDAQTNTVRLDIMADNNLPIISLLERPIMFARLFGRWADSRISQKTSYRVSVEHAAYIGSELEKADTMRIDYVQDGNNKCQCKRDAIQLDQRKTDSELIQDFENENKTKADDIVEKYNRQILDEEQFDFMIVFDATRFVKFERKIDSTIALACSSMYYLHECPDTNRVFLCQAGIDNNIAELKNVNEFENWLNSDVG